MLGNTSVSSRWREIDPRDWCLGILRRMCLCLFFFQSLVCTCGRSSLCNNGTSTDVCHQFGEETSKATKRETGSAREDLFRKIDGSME